MGIEVLATTVIALLSPYLNKAGEAFAEKAGEKLFEKVGELYQAIKQKFAGDAYAEQTLTRVEEQPQSKGRLATFEQILVEQMEDDSSFAELLNRLVEEAKVVDGKNVIAFGERSVAIRGDVQSSTIITGDRNATKLDERDGSGRGSSGELIIIRVFLSSTWLDLQPERAAVQTVLQKLRETKFIGMEYFGSRDETTRQASLDEVDSSDVYIGIFGGRYGSGITEAEYHRAREKNLPCFIYLKAETAIASNWREMDSDNVMRLAALKAELHRHTVSTFNSPEDLASKVMADLHRWLFDEYLVPKLENATRNEHPSQEIQYLIAEIKDQSALSKDLLNRLQGKGYVLAFGSRSVSVGGNVTGSNITTGDV